MQNLIIFTLLWFCVVIYKFIIGEDHVPALIIGNIYLVGIFIVQAIKEK